jgi:glycosyltransferase involved in cell wall biosynthesis
MPDLRVLMLNLEYPPLGGGAAPMTRGLAHALLRQGHQVDVVTMGYRGLPQQENDGGVRVFRVPGIRSRVELSHVHELATYVWSGLRKVKALTRATSYDICHCHFIIPTGIIPYLLRASAGFPPYVITSHGSDVPGFNPDRFTLLHRITPPILRRVLRGASAVIVPSTALQRLVREQFSADVPSLTQIPNGMALDQFTPRPKESRILVATRLFERKGVHHLIAALANVADHGHTLEVAGDGPQRSALEQQAGQTGVPAHFHGWLPPESLYPLYERSRIFVLASISDNFPVSLLEAMAARCAIITTRAGGCPEVVGDAGLVVEPGDVEGLCRALNRLIRHPAVAEELGERAARRVREHFGWPAIASRHEAVYRKAISGAGRPAAALATPT